MNREINYIMKTNQYISVFLVAAALLLVSGCSTTYKVDQDLVKQFKPTSNPTAEQTFVYVIRGSSAVGGMRGMWIAANDKVVADLSSGTHALLKLDAGINSIHAVQALAGFGYIAVDNKPGETVFLRINYTTAKMEKLDRELGITMVMETDEAKELTETRHNTAYDNLLINPSVLGFKIMTETASTIEPDENTAVINFIRAETLGSEIPFDLWSEQGFVGSTKGSTYFQVRVNPGEHTFLAFSERYSALKANVEAGREYFAEVDIDMGWNQAHIQIIPMSTTEDAKQIAKWRSNAKLIALDPTVLASDEFSQRIELALDLVNEKIEQVKMGKINSRKLEP